MTQSDEDFVDDLDDLDDDNLDELNPTPARSTSDKGLTKDEKQLLLKCVDKKGGIAKCSRESGIVEAICNWKPTVFGLANSPKRKATQNVITKWKQHARNKTFYKIRDDLEVPQPKNVCDEEISTKSAPNTRSAKAATKKAATTKAATTTTTTSAPVKSISLSMSSIKSPAKLMRKKKATSKAEDIEGMSVDWLGLSHHFNLTQCLIFYRGAHRC